MERERAMTINHRRYATAEAELANGFAEHATMGAEAMLTFGLDPAAALAWSDRHDPAPVTDGYPLDIARKAIARELADEHWASVMRR